MIGFLRSARLWFLILWWISEYEYKNIQKKKRYMGAIKPYGASFLPLHGLFSTFLTVTFTFDPNHHLKKVGV